MVECSIESFMQKISEFNLSAFICRLFHEDFSTITRRNLHETVSFCLVIPALSEDIQCHVEPLFPLLANIRTLVKWDVNLVIVYGHFNLPEGFV